MSLIFLFIDGVGLGRENSDNPFYHNEYQGFSFINKEQPFSSNASEIVNRSHLFKAVDATLGIEGLPQSGTGQTTLFTGENAADVIGKHFGPFPHSKIKYLLRERSVFIQAQQQGKSCCFINAYPELYFEKARRRNRWSCTTLMTQSAAIPLNTTLDVKQERAITAGITQQAWREMLEIDVPEITPETAAHRLLKKAKEQDLILHEYYLTDKAGHAQSPEKAANVISVYDRFLQRLIKEKEPHDTLVLCSDHGNVEDLSTKTHTLNKVPLFVYGPGTTFFKKAESIMDVTPAILKTLTS